MKNKGTVVMHNVKISWMEKDTQVSIEIEKIRYPSHLDEMVIKALHNLVRRLIDEKFNRHRH